MTISRQEAHQQIRWGLAAAVMAIALASHAGPGWAQNPPTTVQLKQKGDYKVGDPCVRRSDTHPGVVKQDACGRVYCARRDIKDITELAPGLVKDVGCTWRLDGSRCTCHKPAKAKQGK